MNVDDGADGRVQRIDRSVGQRLGRCLNRALAADVVRVYIASGDAGVMCLVGTRDMAGLCAADDKPVRIALAYADIAIPDAVPFLVADEYLVI